MRLEGGVDSLVGRDIFQSGYGESCFPAVCGLRASPWSSSSSDERLSINEYPRLVATAVFGKLAEGDGFSLLLRLSDREDSSLDCKDGRPLVSLRGVVSSEVSKFGCCKFPDLRENRERPQSWL